MNRSFKALAVFTLIVSAAIGARALVTRLEGARNPAAYVPASTALEVIEGGAWYLPRVATVKSAGSALASGALTEIDVRGVGDSAWTNPGPPGNRPRIPVAPVFGEAIARIDPSGTLFKADVSFINWESVVGVECKTVRQSVDFYFISHPRAIEQAIASGFNAFSVSNNHCQDCMSGKSAESSAAIHGPLMTAESMTRLAAGKQVVWHGTGSDPWSARVVDMTIKGRRVRVALGAIALINWDIENSAFVNFEAPVQPGQPDAFARASRLLVSLRDAPADVRILSIHTQDASGNDRPEAAAFKLLKRVAEAFITDYRGTLVFGEGPHTYGGVRVIDRPGGGRGAVFTSMGNFVHQGLGEGVDNYVARALLDPADFRVVEVQAMPFTSQRVTVKFRDGATMKQQVAGGKAVRANFEWSVVRHALDARSSVSAFHARFE